MEALMKIAHEEGIFVDYQDLILPQRNLYGCYFYDPEREVPFILLDHSLKQNLPLHRSVMAEELGHHFTIPQANFLAPYTSYTRALELGRDEAKALCWACDYLMPMPKFMEALNNGIATVALLAEHFTVTPWLVYRRIELAKSKYDFCHKGLYCLA